MNRPNFDVGVFVRPDDGEIDASTVGDDARLIMQLAVTFWIDQQ
jgi:hypothetical protein